MVVWKGSLVPSNTDVSGSDHVEDLTLEGSKSVAVQDLRPMALVMAHVANCKLVAGVALVGQVDLQ